jgi:hypothetical protein
VRIGYNRRLFDARAVDAAGANDHRGRPALLAGRPQTP